MSDKGYEINVFVHVHADSDNSGSPPKLRVDDGGNDTILITLQGPDRTLRVSRSGLLRAITVTSEKE